MTSRSTQAFFAELGVAQSFSRPRTPTDNATCESWMATLKSERLYEAGFCTPQAYPPRPGSRRLARPSWSAEAERST